LSWIDDVIQGVSGAAAVENGQNDPTDKSGQQTAQEIQFLAAKAKERAQNVSKYHKRYWEAIGNIFVALVVANGSDMTQQMPISGNTPENKGCAYEEGRRKLLDWKPGDPFPEPDYAYAGGRRWRKQYHP
jgi:hypothetical protein